MRSQARLEVAERVVRRSEEVLRAADTAREGLAVWLFGLSPTGRSGAPERPPEGLGREAPFEFGAGMTRSVAVRKSRSL